ncbi:MAG: N-acetylmuramoyl-L-alanine amidase [Candidatus Omnitrophota bacterium]
MKRYVYWILILGLALILSSCATTPIQAPAPVVKEAYPVPTGPIVRHDVFHTVAPGETFWRIGKMYDVKVADIMRANNIARPKELEMGQRLVIPRAAPIKPVITLYRSNKWKYIIIHHSATDDGDALSLNNLHSRRGFAGLGYHFVIDNGSSSKVDGQIESSPRWIKQQDGAHCKAAGMNHKGIGICLVGNFSKERVSRNQMDSLVYLVNTLKKYYRIPDKCILGHGQVPGARTECPGNYFPWSEFKNRLR